ncbi:hypothetical protein WCE39_07875 [Luteimonas sp. MJ174]|uniref:hypothetical protein n=1 Tax=Luteimonas sp. MJ174 TaxID=3129237 RepID=UPI0031B9E033
MSSRTAAGRGKAFVGDVSIPINRLHLDLNNPRHEPAASEAEAIENLCDDEMVAELAQDIAGRGGLSPLEVLGVVEMDGNPGHYVSLEGNRRTCALMLLGDPRRAPPKFRSQIERIASGANHPKAVKAHVFKSAGDAKQWIDLRHLGLQGGAGTKEWGSTQKQRAAGQNTKTSARANTLAVLVLDRLVQRGLISKQERDAAKVTTLTRYLGTPGVRAILGIASPNSLQYTHDADEVDVALQRLVLDSITPAKDGACAVHSRSNSSQRLAYAHSLVKSRIAPTTQLPVPSAPPAPTRSLKSASGTPTKRGQRDPKKRPTLFDSSFTISSTDLVLRRMRSEAVHLPVADYLFASTYLLRAIVEGVMTLYLRSQGALPSDRTDAKLTAACYERLKLAGFAGRGMSALAKATGNPATSYSLHSLGNALHGGVVPGPDDIKGWADTWQPILLEMLERIPESGR